MADLFRKLEDKVLSDEVRHDEKVINDEREKINEHKMQIADDKSKLLKDLHEKEIKHDEKVLDRKEADASKHEAKIKDNEEVIHEVE